MDIVETARRIVAENNQARTRQTAAFAGLIEQAADPSKPIDLDAIIATLTEEPAADENTETNGR